MKKHKGIKVGLSILTILLFLFGVYNIVEYKYLSTLILYNIPTGLKIAMVFFGAFILISTSTLIFFRKLLGIACWVLIAQMVIFITVVHIRNPYHSLFFTWFMIIKDLIIIVLASLIFYYRKKLEKL